jgi:hypothetical protein
MVYAAQLLTARLPDAFANAPPEELLFPRRSWKKHERTPVAARFLSEGSGYSASNG